MVQHLLKKLFKVRDKVANKDSANPDREMPFLEHLEELRNVLIKVVITLLVATIGAFCFNKPLMNLMRYPVKLAGLGVEENRPSELSEAEWKRCKELAKIAAALPEAGRASFYDRATADQDSQKFRPYLEAIPYFHASLFLEREKREDFINALPNNAGFREKALALIAANPIKRLERESNLISMSALKPTEGFMISIKLSLYAGIAFSLPLLLYFIGQFIFPGLHTHEKKVVFPFIGIGFGLFIIGVIFAYYVVTPEALKFFHDYAAGLGISSDWRIGEYTTFVSQVVLAFGLSFELPVVVMILVKLGMLSYDFMSKNRSYAIIIIVAVAAIITPTPDAFVLCLLAGPLVFLYEICIWMAYFMHKKELKREAQEEAERALRPPPAKPPVDLSPGALAATSSASDHFPIEENDALREPDADEPAPPVYEVGFGPSDPEAPKPTPAPEILPMEPAEVPEPEARVDGEATLEHKEPSEAGSPAPAPKPPDDSATP